MDDDLFHDDEYGDDEYGDEPADEAGGAGGLSTRTRVLIGAGIVAAIALIGGIVVALTGDGDAAAKPPPTTQATTTTVPEITTTTEPDTGPVAPLTGLRLVDGFAALRPALAVKIDNLDAAKESALPQAGLAKADIVFEEIVEGNITRLVAIFHSQAPGSRVGPVRSARTTDVHILPQLGRTLLAWSGGNDGVVAAVHGTPSIIDLGHDRASSSYTRDGSKKAPHNLYVDAGRLYGLAPDEVTPPQPLFEYRADGAELPGSAKKSAGVDLSWGGGVASSPVGWTWDAELELYKRTQRGRPHTDEDGPIVSQNVVVLETEYGQSAADTRSPEAHTIGSGRAFVFTAGHVIEGRWERPAAEQPARLTTDDGQVIALTPGQTWVELPRAGGVAPR